MPHECVTIGPCVLYRGDCLEVLPTLATCAICNGERFVTPVGSEDQPCGECGGIGRTVIDAVVADPPYGISYKSGSLSRSNLASGKVGVPIVGDDRAFDPSHILALGVPTVLWGANNYAASLPNNYGWIVWDKRPGGERNDHSDCEMAWTSHLKSVRKHSQRWMGIMRDGEECPFIGGGLVHPTQKPVALMRFCITLTPGETILDPYMGSGTTGVACINTDRKFIGIEIEPKYFDIACKRIERAWREKRSELPYEKPAPLVQRSEP